MYSCEMNITSLEIPEIKIIQTKKFGDDRGYFSETYNKKLLEKNSITIDFIQDNQSLSTQENVLRGLHYQSPPFAQDKLVRCLAGSILDVAVDIRKESPTYGKHIKKIISSDNFEQILVPVGFAHGFVTLEPNTLVMYKVSNYYSAENDNGIMWNDSQINIDWGIDEKSVILSEKDSKQPSFSQIKSPF